MIDKSECGEFCGFICHDWCECELCMLEDHVFDSTCENCIERGKNIDPKLKAELKAIGDKHWKKNNTKVQWFISGKKEDKDYWENNSDPDSLGPMQDLEYDRPGYQNGTSRFHQNRPKLLYRNDPARCTEPLL